MGIFVALLFLFNLFAVVPNSIQHPKEDGVSHSISAEVVDFSKSHEKDRHDHIEHCGMASCTIAFIDIASNTKVISATKTRFALSHTVLETLHHAPPGRPPLV